MAMKFMCSCGDHFDDVSAAYKWDVYRDVSITASGYNSTKAIDAGLTPYTQPRIVKAVSPSPAHTIYAGWRMYVPAATFPLGGGFSYYLLGAIHYKGTGSFSNSTKQISINIHTDGRIYIVRGNYSGTVLGTTAGAVLTNDTWHSIGVKAVIHATLGEVVVMVDGAPVLQVTGVNTLGLSTAAIDGVEPIPWRVDDVYINDTSGTSHTGFEPAGFHVKVARPNSAYLSEWTPTSGDNYTNVDDTNPDGATDVSTAFADLTDLYGLETLSDGTVCALQANGIASKASASVPATFVHVVEIDGARYESAVQTLTTTPKDWFAVWPVAPDDNLAWTVAKINASKFGVRRVS